MADPSSRSGWLCAESIRRRITAVVLFGQLLTMVVAAVAIFGLTQLSQTSDAQAQLSAAQRHYQHGDMMHDALRAEVYRGVLAASRGASPEERQDILDAAREDAAAYRHDIEALAALSLDPVAARPIAEVRPALEVYIDHSLALLTQAVVDPISAEAALPAAEQRFRETAEAQERVLAGLEALDARLDKAASDGERRAIGSIGAGALVTLLSLLGLTGWLGRSIVGSLRRLGDVAEHVVKGDLKARATIERDDEIGALAASFNAMADSLTSYVDLLAADAQRDGFRGQLVEALEMADDEGAATSVVERAMVEVEPNAPMELLLSDSSRANMERNATSPQAGAPGCPVKSPFSCPAVRKGSSVVFPDSGALAACPHLRGRPDGACSAVCVPVSFMGRSLGVLHATGPVGGSMTAEQVARLTVLATQAGARIGTVRAFQKTQLQAATDSLTGLLNRRSFENEVRRHLSAGGPVAIAIADLDHFKALNDTAGHDAGDRALRLFSKVLRESVRGEDVVGRYGGEEFVLAFPNLDRNGGRLALERIRRALAAAQRGDGPTFTCSFGVTDTGFGRELSELIALADSALYRAKEGGRDRVEVAPSEVVELATVRRSAPPMRAAAPLPFGASDSLIPGPRSRASQT